MNVEILSAAAYQRATSYQRRSLSGGPLDWSNQPQVFKRYRNGQEIVLPPPEDWPRTALAEAAGCSGTQAPIGLDDLGRVLALAYGITAQAQHGGEAFYYRSVPSAGALYPCELYLAAQTVAGLDAGLYHYQVGRHRLTELRRRQDYGSVRGLYAGMEASEPALVIFISTLFFRSAWKYRQRSYRYLLLDSGHLLENLDLGLRLLGHRGNPLVDFDDAQVSGLLGFDPDREAVLALLSLPGREGDLEPVPSTASDCTALPPVEPEASRCAARDANPAEVLAIHRLSSKRFGPITGARPPLEPAAALGLNVARWAPIAAPAPAPAFGSSAPALADLIRSRRSRRNFIPKTLSRDVWQAMLHDLCRPGWLPAGAASGPESTVAVGLVSERLAGLDPGFYLLDRRRCRLGTVRSLPMIEAMASVCLDQGWIGQAACHLVFLARLDQIEAAHGPRGYRQALIEAGRLAQRLYLTAEQFGLGACGIGAFYDEEARELLALPSVAAMLYLLALGPVKKRL